MRRTFTLCNLSLLLAFAAGTTSAQTEKPASASATGGDSATTVRTAMRNVDYHLTDRIIVNITSLNGRLTPKPGAASSNAVATMIALERELKTTIAPQEKLRIAAEVGSDLPLFLIGGTVLGVDRGQEVYGLQDLPPMHLVVVAPPVGVSTPKAFAQWDALLAQESAPNVAGKPELTASSAAGTITTFSQSVFAWLEKVFPLQAQPASGVPASGGDRAETPLLDLVRTGIENDFERVVFPEYPELREVKRVLEREGALYASLSGSGSTLYGLFASAAEAESVAQRVSAAGHAAVATTTLSRAEYWKRQLVTGDW